MITIPNEVAEMITYFGVHPVTAWRKYYKISEMDLALETNLTTEQINKIESSNLHLKPEFLEKLSKAFGVFPEVFDCRFQRIN